MADNPEYPKQDFEVKNFEKPKVMMATKAIHELGDLSSKNPSLCEVFGECKIGRKIFFIGSWVIGFGFVNILFPAKTTRDLNKEELEKYAGEEFGTSMLKIRIHADATVSHYSAI